MKKAIIEFRNLLATVPPLLITALVLSVVGMNLLANKSINTGTEWLALDCGIVFSGLTFLAMDIMTHCYGPRGATLMSVTALLFNLVMALLFFAASRIPGVWGESFVEGSEDIINGALNNTFGGTWFILLGSSIAFVSSAVINNFMNYGIGKLFKGKDGFGIFAARSYISTFVAQFSDNLIFALLVSKIFFGWTLLQCFTCALTGALLELLFEIFLSPLGYRISRKILKNRQAVPADTEAK
ncbi:MAG: VUT family protein [Clostridia bacterium]|nr:VUT family protein [Clostridia bacterium]